MDEQLVELKKIKHLIRWIAVIVTGSSIGFLLLLIGTRVEVGSGFSVARLYYFAGIGIILLSLIVGLSESLRSDKEE